MTSARPPRARFQATLTAVGTVYLWSRIGGLAPAIIAGIACCLAGVAWASPAHYAPVQRVLDRSLHALLAGFTWFLLALLYFGLFTPLRLWRGLIRKDPLQRHYDPAAATYLKPLPPALPRHFDRQF